MRDGDAEGLLRVILEIGLAIFIGVAVDDVDGVFISADGAVAAEPPEFEGHLARAVGIDRVAERQREVRHVVGDADREVVFRFGLREVVEDGDDLRRVGVF